MSRRDLLHVLHVLQRAGAAGTDAGDVAEAIGRSRGDMRTALNLASLAGEGTAEEIAPGRWALTDAGIAWLAQDDELSDR